MNCPHCGKAIEPTKTPVGAFEQFWSVYPRKVSKGAAERAWRALKPDSHLAARIHLALEVAKQSESWQKEGGQFIPYPATWLRAKGWLDEYQVKTASPSAMREVERTSEFDIPKLSDEERAANKARIGELLTKLTKGKGI